MARQASNYETGGDRPACEVEITPEMIEAGMRVFGDFDQQWESLGEKLVEVFRAMVAVFSWGGLGDRLKSSQPDAD